MCSFLFGAALWNCQNRGSEQTSIPDQSDKKWDQKRAELEYQLLRAELRLAKSEEPYLVVDLDREELRLMLKGAVVWNQPVNLIETDSQKLQEFADGFRSDKGDLIRCLSAKHLFAAESRTPDSVLAIVGKAARVDPKFLQRDVPGHFELMWGYGLILEIRTDISGQPKSRLKNALIEFRHLLRRPFGVAHIVVKMGHDDAITLYRACKPGLATLVYPPV